MDDQQEPTAWQETTGLVSQPEQRAISSQTTANYTNLTPATKAEFAAALTPCLSLVAGVGLKGDERREWLHAAYIALGDMPVDLLKRGTHAAMRTADHPSKIVPAIIAECASALEARKRNRGPSLHDQAMLQRALPAPGESQCLPEEAAEIIAKFKIGAKHNSPRDPWRPAPVSGPSGAPGRKPTREDYIKIFGVAPEILDAIDAENGLPNAGTPA